MNQRTKRTEKKRINKQIKPIKFRQTLFWDVDPKTIDPKKHARYIIERILDFGNDKEIRWMWNYYNHDLIRDVLKMSRALFPKTRIFWNLMLSS